MFFFTIHASSLSCDSLKILRIPHFHVVMKVIQLNVIPTHPEQEHNYSIVGDVAIVDRSRICC